MVVSELTAGCSRNGQRGRDEPFPQAWRDLTRKHSNMVTILGRTTWALMRRLQCGTRRDCCCDETLLVQCWTCASSSTKPHRATAYAICICLHDLHLTYSVCHIQTLNMSAALRRGILPRCERHAVATKPSSSRASTTELQCTIWCQIAAG